MNTEEAGRIVAKHDGWKACHISGEGTWYLKEGKTLRLNDLVKEYLSLDTLVEIWDGLGASIGIYYLMGTHNITTPYGKYLYKSMSVQEAVCIATAKTIEALND